MIDLSVIIVTWNSRKDMEACLSSLPHGVQRHTFEVLLVDNASADDTVALSRKVMPSVLVEFLDAHPVVWACGPGMLNRDGTPQRTGVRFPSLWNLFVETLYLDRVFPSTRLFGRHREFYEDPLRAHAVDYVQGSCLMLRREVLDSIGKLDEGFFMYFEETDWCYRIGKAGGKVWIVPSAGVIHFGGETAGHYDERRLVFYYRSLLRFFDKHHTVSARIAVRFVVFARSLIRIVSWCIIGMFKPGLRGAAWSSCRGYARVVFGMGRSGV
ncbi:MAG: hypothetical protein H6Q31_2894 [Bacteroidetes bacterium]|nr:hypothetical protein [Bacteroidota bacterium]